MILWVHIIKKFEKKVKYVNTQNTIAKYAWPTLLIYVSFSVNGV